MNMMVKIWKSVKLDHCFILHKIHLSFFVSTSEKKDVVEGGCPMSMKKTLFHMCDVNIFTQSFSLVFN